MSLKCVCNARLMNGVISAAVVQQLRYNLFIIDILTKKISLDKKNWLYYLEHANKIKIS